MAGGPWYTRITRDGVLFVAGLFGVGYETLYSQQERWGLLALFAGMLGLPAFLRTDERRRNDQSNQAD